MATDKVSTPEGRGGSLEEEGTQTRSFCELTELVELLLVVIATWFRRGVSNARQGTSALPSSGRVSPRPLSPAKNANYWLVTRFPLA